MFRARQPFPAPQPLPKSSVPDVYPDSVGAPAFTPARSGRYLFSDPFNFKLSTVHLSSDAAFLPRIDAKLTRVKHKSFVCRSYKKHRGWGIPVCSCSCSSLPITLAPVALTNLFRITFFAHPCQLSLIESYSCKKRGVGVGTTFPQLDLAVRPANTANGLPAGAESFFVAPPPEVALSPVLAPAAPISIARRTSLFGASSRNATLPSFTSTPRIPHKPAISTRTGLAFHSEYNFSSTPTPVARSPIWNTFSISQSWRMSPPASRIPRSAS